ncbi:hypothetical protein TcWFU_005642 [Taenia crassiceps]|uniref:EGF-like domain-containing protein n=1 Tax=Taenia crassiceps TaxID=6207 RepID=A0ABR4QR71_9CEST
MWGSSTASVTPMLMFSSTRSLFVVVFFSASLLLVDSRLTVIECANGTPNCSHGRCVQRMGWDKEKNPVNEQRCICDPNFYGEACDLLVVSDFTNPVLISPGLIKLVALESPNGPAVTDAVNEKHSYGGAA